jgi:hypothetical protein
MTACFILADPLASPYVQRRAGAVHAPASRAIAFEYVKICRQNGALRDTPEK